MTYNEICSSYSGKCLHALLDVVGLFVEIFSADLQEEKIIEVVSTPLVQKYVEISENDKMIIPIVKCIKEVMKVFGPAMANFFPLIFEKSLKIVADVLDCLEHQGVTQEYYAIEALHLLTDVFKNWQRGKA